MESGEKGKYIVVVVAIIGALATVSVPVVSHYFPTPKDKIDNNPVGTSKTPVEKPMAGMAIPTPDPVQKHVDSVSKNPSPEDQHAEVPHVAPPPGEDGALNLQTVGSHLAVNNYGAAYRTAIYLVSAQPDNPQFHACLADLSIAQGLMVKAADEFKKAADLGLTGEAIHEARVRENLPILNAGYLYVAGTEFDSDQAILFNDLRKAEIPGTIPFREKLCSDAKKTTDYQNENYSKERRMYAPYAIDRECTSDPGKGQQFNDCF